MDAIREVHIKPQRRAEHDLASRRAGEGVRSPIQWARVGLDLGQLDRDVTVDQSRAEKRMSEVQKVVNRRFGTHSGDRIDCPDIVVPMTRGTEISRARSTVRNWLGLALLLFVLVSITAFAESWNGIRPVASTLNGVAALVFFLLGTTLLVAVVFRRSQKRWATCAVAAPTLLIVILSAFGAYAVNQGHTSADRFAKEIAAFGTPAGFTIDKSATEAAEPDPNQTQYVARVWQGGETSAFTCPAVAKAFKDWDGGPVRSSADNEHCSFGSREGYRNIRLNLEGNVLTLEMWLEKSSALVF